MLSKNHSSDFFNSIDFFKKSIYNEVKYSPPIEAGASFNPPNLAEEFILRASVSEAMGFL